MHRLLLFLFCLPLVTSGQTLRFMITDPVAQNVPVLGAAPGGTTRPAAGNARTKPMRESVDWSSQGLRRVPTGLDTLGWRPTVDLSNNRLRKLPERTLGLRVDTLLLSGNRLGHGMRRVSWITNRPLKATAGMPHTVRYLDLSHNELSRFNLAQVPRATYVDLSWNQLVQVLCHQHLFNASLDTLILRGNLLTELPANIEVYGDLEYLDLSNNLLIGKKQWRAKYMRNLQTLDVSNNNLSRVPRSWRKLPSIVKIDLRGNPLNEKEVAKARRMFGPGVELLTD